MEFPDLEGLIFEEDNEIGLRGRQTNAANESRLGFAFLAYFSDLSGTQID